MAFIGMRHVVAATLSSHTDGADPTYGTGMVVGMAIQGNVTINRNNNPLYADDTIAEDDNSITSMEVEVGVDDLTEAAEAYLLGTKAVEGTGTNPPVTYIDRDESAPAVGFGYIRVRRKNGVTTYQGVWYYKAVFGMGSENSQTKGESIEWQTPTLTARCAGVSVDDSGAKSFRKRQSFATEAAAMKWLDDLAGIS